jgi:Zn-dependent protease/CBS domain-containing protein
MDTRQGFQIGTIRGIPIRIHYTFLLVLPFLAYGFGSSFAAAARLAGVPHERLAGSPWLWGLGITLALFVSVLVHELAHSFYTLAVGGAVRSITLLMIGGVSEIVEPPRKPMQEAAMAFVGPATSVAIGAAFYALSRATRGLGSFNLTFALFYLAQLNLFLGAFNLLPAFPMDGGRVLRGFLARRRGMVRATQIAAAVGRAFALLFAIVGFLTTNFLLLIIGFFVFVGAEGEQREVLTRALLGELRVAELLVPQASSVAPADTLYEVGERMLREKRLVFPVEEDGRVVGLVTLEDVERSPLPQRRVTPTAQAMRPAVTLAPEDRVADALRMLAGQRATCAVVVGGGRLLGTLSQLDIARGLKLRELEVSQHPRPAGPSRGSAPA